MTFIKYLPLERAPLRGSPGLSARYDVNLRYVPDSVQPKLPLGGTRRRTVALARAAGCRHLVLSFAR